MKILTLLYNKRKLIEGIILVIVLLGLIIYSIAQSQRAATAEEKLKLNKNPIQTKTEPIKIYIDTAGKRHIVISGEANKIAQSNVKAIGEGTVKLLDSVALALNMSLKDRETITQLTKLSTTTTQENIILKKQIDSLKGKIVTLYSYKDKYLDLVVRKSDTSDNLLANYTYNDDITYVDYSKRKWIFGVKKPFTDLYSSNPNTTIRGTERLTIEHPISTFGLRIKGSTLYNINTKVLSVGPGVEVDLGNKIDVSAFYLKDLSHTSWIPVVRLDYNLINL